MGKVAAVTQTERGETGEDSWTLCRCCLCYFSARCQPCPTITSSVKGHVYLDITYQLFANPSKSSANLGQSCNALGRHCKMNCYKSSIPCVLICFGVVCMDWISCKWTALLAGHACAVHQGLTVTVVQRPGATSGCQTQELTVQTDRSIKEFKNSPALQLAVAISVFPLTPHSWLPTAVTSCWQPHPCHMCNAPNAVRNQDLLR